MLNKRPQRSRCPLCLCALEKKSGQLVCLNCLVIWHGDTFEPFPLRLGGVYSIDELYQ